MADPRNPKRPRREEIEILLPAIKPYVRGTAPRRPRISLLPVHDSTAYIVDKVINPPGPALDKEVHRKLCYVISWTDLPAARIMIPCTRVLDYVSPRKLEEWEYNDALRREEEEFEEETKMAIALSLGKDPAAEAEPKQPKVKKRRGRPPRAAMRDQAPPTPVLAAEDEALIARKKAAGPSLSTPQKRRPEEFTEIEDEYESDAAMLQRQLFEDADTGTDAPGPAAYAHDEYEEDLERALEAEMSLAEEEEEESSQASSARPVTVSALPEATRTPRGAWATRRQTVEDGGESLRVSSARPAAMPFLPGTSSPLRGVRAMQGLTLASSTAKRKRGSDASIGGSSQLEIVLNDRVSPITPLNASDFTEMLRPPPAKTQKLDHAVGSEGQGPQSRSATPASQRLNHPAGEEGLSSQSPSGTPVSSMRGKQVRTNGTSLASPMTSSSTPAASSQARPLPRPPAAIPTTIHEIISLDDEINLVPTSSMPAPSTKKKKGRKPKLRPDTPTQAPPPADQAPPAGEEQAWEVMRLEADRLQVEEDGTTVRYFRVRWKGEWPPDQNPTWEPEENITKSLIKKYLKKKAAKEAEKAERAAAAAAAAGKSQATPKPTKKSQTTLSPWVGGKKYASVTEAFQDGADEAITGMDEDFGPRRDGGEEEDEDDDNEFAVIEERTISPARSAQRARSSFDADLTRQFRPYSQASNY